eukprot:GHVS01074545.1.p1 GENE.GHVS01074545.1~~GHVS01074545.1.p1  ORF type:complete len:574 (+),score=150.49 GHVS01074545.1:1453-3174(+)
MPSPGGILQETTTAEAQLTSAHLPLTTAPTPDSSPQTFPRDVLPLPTIEGTSSCSAGERSSLSCSLSFSSAFLPSLTSSSSAPSSPEETQFPPARDSHHPQTDLLVNSAQRLARDTPPPPSFAPPTRAEAVRERGERSQQQQRGAGGGLEECLYVQMKGSKDSDKKKRRRDELRQYTNRSRRAPHQRTDHQSVRGSAGSTASDAPTTNGSALGHSQQLEEDHHTTTEDTMTCAFVPPFSSSKRQHRSNKVDKNFCPYHPELSQHAVFQSATCAASSIMPVRDDVVGLSLPCGGGDTVLVLAPRHCGLPYCELPSFPHTASVPISLAEHVALLTSHAAFGCAAAPTRLWRPEEHKVMGEEMMSTEDKQSVADGGRHILRCTSTTSPNYYQTTSTDDCSPGKPLTQDTPDYMYSTVSPLSPPLPHPLFHHSLLAQEAAAVTPHHPLPCCHTTSAHCAPMEPCTACARPPLASSANCSSPPSLPPPHTSTTATPPIGSSNCCASCLGYISGNNNIGGGIKIADEIWWEFDVYGSARCRSCKARRPLVVQRIDSLRLSHSPGHLSQILSAASVRYED